MTTTTRALCAFSATVAVALCAPPKDAMARTLAPAAAARPAGLWIEGLWQMQGYKSTNDYSAHDRAARTTDGRPPPLQPWAAELLEKRLNEADQHGRIYADTASRCLPQGVPAMIFQAVTGPVQFLNTSGQITVISQEFNELWLIHLGGSHPKDVEPTFHGHSVGQWRKNDLVVDTIGLNEKTTIDQVGTPHSSRLHVVTRFHQLDAQTMEILVTLDDPKTFTNSWTRRVVYKRSPPGAQIEEEVCENQRNGVDSEGYQQPGFN